MGYMALKIDLEKAYDKLEWSFIRDMMIRANFPEDLVELIMSCVSTVSTEIMVNGEALEPIYPSRGLGKATLFHRTFSSYVWSSLVISFKKNAIPSFGSR